VKEGTFMAGQIAGLVDRIQPAKDIIEEMFAQYEDAVRQGGSI